jgi:hypothetical protein
MEISLEKYAERKELGHIWWERENDIAVLCIQNFDIMHEKTDVVKMQFSKLQAEVLANAEFNKISSQKQQALKMLADAESYEKTFKETRGLMFADVAETLKD